MDHHRRQVEDFTNPFLVMAGVVAFILMFIVWAAVGYLAALASGALAHAVLRRIPRRD